MLDGNEPQISPALLEPLPDDLQRTSSTGDEIGVNSIGEKDLQQEGPSTRRTFNKKDLQQEGPY